MHSLAAGDAEGAGEERDGEAAQEGARHRPHRALKEGLCGCTKASFILFGQPHVHPAAPQVSRISTSQSTPLHSPP